MSQLKNTQNSDLSVVCLSSGSDDDVQIISIRTNINNKKSPKSSGRKRRDPIESKTRPTSPSNTNKPIEIDDDDEIPLVLKRKKSDETPPPQSLPPPQLPPQISPQPALQKPKSVFSPKKTRTKTKLIQQQAQKEASDSGSHVESDRESLFAQKFQQDFDQLRKELEPKHNQHNLVVLIVCHLFVRSYFLTQWKNIMNTLRRCGPSMNLSILLLYLQWLQHVTMLPISTTEKQSLSKLSIE